MEKKTKNLIVTIGVSSFVTALVLKKAQDKNYLRSRGLINKNTKVLDVYTCDYFVENLIVLKEVLPLIDKRNGEKSSVYTTRAKDTVLDVCSEDFEIRNNFEKEYKQILRFAAELNAVAPDAKMVIHVVSNLESDKFEKIKEESAVKKLDIKIEIDTELTEEIFEE